jgi:NAD(P)-dependent dehydrogenase (short-subunit alcohol dehydrogenase family)
LYASMRSAQGKSREAAEALRKLGIKTVELDVGDHASVEAGVKNVLADAGKIDVLVNNAGIMSAGVTEASLRSRRRSSSIRMSSALSFANTRSASLGGDPLLSIAKLVAGRRASQGGML